MGNIEHKMKGGVGVRSMGCDKILTLVSIKRGRMALLLSHGWLAAALWLQHWTMELSYF